MLIVSLQKLRGPPLAGVLSEVFHTSLPLACVAEDFNLCHCGLLIFATFLKISPVSKDLVVLKRMPPGTH